jgi:hypothetical protein
MALIVALAATMPVGLHAMPMQSAVNGMAADEPCSSCPLQPQTGPAHMPACQIPACAGSLAILSVPVWVPEAFLRVAYAKGPPTRRPGAGPAPDPFPPRSFVLL